MNHKSTEKVGTRWIMLCYQWQQCQNVERSIFVDVIAYVNICFTFFCFLKGNNQGNQATEHVLVDLFQVHIKAFLHAALLILAFPHISAAVRSQI